MIKNMNKLLTKDEVAEYLGISKASIPNWQKHGIIPTEDDFFEYDEIKNIKDKILNGKIKRLNKRANKTKSNNKFIPVEYLEKKESIDQIKEIVSFITDNNIVIEQAIFLLCINLYIKTGDIKSKDVDTLFEFKIDNFRRKGVYNQIISWLNTFSNGNVNYHNSKVKYLLEFELPNEIDILGIVHQSILNEGKKASLGSYYTPKYIVNDIVTNHIKPEFKVMDPCCGTGQFLLKFTEKIIDPLNIYGFDIDHLAVEISKTNLLLAYKDKDFDPKIFNFNTLTISNSTLIDNDIMNGKFDLIATNPPWGAKYDKQSLNDIQKNIKELKTKESFSFFIIQSYKFLKENGVLSLVLPESFTNVKTHKNIRNFTLKNFSINKINILGKCFKNVLSSVITIEMYKSKCINDSFEIIFKNAKYNCKQERFSLNPNSIFDIYITNDDEKILNKVNNFPNFSLADNTEWALGIVTGDNEKHIKQNKLDENFEPIYKGSDIHPFKLNNAKNFIHFNPDNYQQVAPTEKYRAKEKLIYKFISNSLVFAYDNKQSITLNSANILIPNCEYLSIKVIAAILNSDLFNFYFRKKFNTIKILRGDIESLPLPKLNLDQVEMIENIVNDIIVGNAEKTKLDTFIFRLYDLNNQDICIINSFLAK